MTTIAYRDGVMAADSRAYTGNRPPIGAKAKIQRLADGSLFGCSSTIPGRSEALAQWFGGGADPSKIPAGDNHSILVVKPGGEVFFSSDCPHFSGPLSGEFFAIGSGGEYALGALAMGADALRAIEVACDLDVWSARPITVLKLEA